MLDLPGYGPYAYPPEYDRHEAELEKASEHVDRLSAQEIAEQVFYDDAAKARKFLARYGSRLLCDAHPHLTWMSDWYGEADDGAGAIWWLMWSAEDCLDFLHEDCCKDLLLEHFGEGLAEGQAEAWNEPPEN